ncbi:MAG: hypothetical protein Q9170_001988 [Blastenia crenularia]
MSMALPGYALVTGAGSGLGRGIAIAFAAFGSAGVLFTNIDGEAALRVSTESKEFLTNPDYRALAL